MKEKQIILIYDIRNYFNDKFFIKFVEFNFREKKNYLIVNLCL